MIIKAEADHYSAVHELRKTLAVDEKNLHLKAHTIKDTGFLVGPYPQEEYLFDIYKKYFLLDFKNDELRGYIRLMYEVDTVFKALDHKGEVNWFDVRYRKIYYQMLQKHITIDAIGVNAKHQCKNVGSGLLQFALSELQNRGFEFLFSFVVTKPLYNHPSLVFHEKKGFQIIAELNTTKLYELDNYQCQMLVKKLK